MERIGNGFIFREDTFGPLLGVGSCLGYLGKPDDDERRAEGLEIWSVWSTLGAAI